MEFRGIRTNFNAPHEECSKLTRLLESFPLILEGISKNGYLSTEDEPITLNFTKDEFATIFECTPQEGAGVNCYQDAYLINNARFRAPTISLHSIKEGRKSYWDFDGIVDDESYRLRIYPEGVANP